MWPYPYLLELCWAMEGKLLAPVASLSFRDEIDQAKKSKNVFMMGIAHRFEAFLYQKKGGARGTIYKSLRASEKWLSQSGHMVELFRTRLALYHQYLADDREKEARQAFDQAFIDLARSVYIENDKRSEIKRMINQRTQSSLVEEKEYVDYQ